MRIAFTGQFTSAAGAEETITLGCTPCYIKLYNVTTNISYEYFYTGSVSEDIITTGSTGVITTGGTTLATSANGFTVAAAALTTSDVCTYVAYRLEG